MHALSACWRATGRALIGLLALTVALALQPHAASADAPGVLWLWEPYTSADNYRLSLQVHPGGFVWATIESTNRQDVWLASGQLELAFRVKADAYQRLYEAFKKLRAPGAELSCLYYFRLGISPRPKHVGQATPDECSAGTQLVELTKRTLFGDTQRLQKVWGPLLAQAQLTTRGVIGWQTTGELTLERSANGLSLTTSKSSSAPLSPALVDAVRAAFPEATRARFSFTVEAARVEVSLRSDPQHTLHVADRPLDATPFVELPTHAVSKQRRHYRASLAEGSLDVSSGDPQQRAELPLLTNGEISRHKNVEAALFVAAPNALFDDTQPFEVRTRINQSQVVLRRKIGQTTASVCADDKCEEWALPRARGLAALALGECEAGLPMVESVKRGAAQQVEVQARIGATRCTLRLAQQCVRARRLGLDTLFELLRPYRQEPQSQAAQERRKQWGPEPVYTECAPPEERAREPSETLLMP